jgi:hypothetical protein
MFPKRLLRLQPLLLLLTSSFFCALISTTSAGQSKVPAVPVPLDPLELATGRVEVADTPAKREEILDLLARARANTGLNLADGSPYDLKVSFYSSGDVQGPGRGSDPNVGSGEMEETWLSPQSSRWTARLGNYSMLRIFVDGVPFDDRSAGAIPLRIQMVRAAVFWPVRIPPTHATSSESRPMIRYAEANWNGREVTCALISRDVADVLTPGRRWVETEYCIDSKTGLLETDSVAPGIYAEYDYNDALEFHKHTVPRRITIVEDGKPVLMVRIESLEDAKAADPSQFKPTEAMLARGPQPVLSLPVRFPVFAERPPDGRTGVIEPVIVHAILAEDGKVLDAEALQNTDPMVSRAALELVKRSSYPQRVQTKTPLQREAFINVRFAP